MASALSGGGGNNSDPGAKSLASINNTTTRLGGLGIQGSALAQSYGKTGGQSFKDQLLSSLSPLMDLADTGLNIAERPGQAILHGLQAFSGQGANALNPSTIANAAKGFSKGLTDVSGKDNLNLRAAMNENPNVGGRLAGLFDTIGSMALDPTTFLTGGTSSEGKVGLKIIADKLGPDIAKNVADHGIQSLGEPTQAAIKDAILKSDQAAATKAGASSFTEKALAGLSGGNGLKIGIPFAPTTDATLLKSATVRPLAEAAHLPQAVSAIRDSAAGQTLRQAFVPLAKAADTVGKGAAEKLGNVVTQGRAEAANAGADVVSQIRSAVQKSGLSADELKALEPALNLPKSLSLADRLAPLNAAKQGFIEAGRPEAAQMLDTISGLRNDATNALRASGAPTGFPAQLERNVTKEAARAISQNPTQIARAIGLDASATPANITAHIKSMLPNETLEGANQRIASLLGVKNAIETNPLKALTGSLIQSHKEAATANTLKNLMNVTDEAGKPLISAVQRAGDVGRETILGKVYGPKEVLDALEHARVTLTDDHALKQFGTLFDKWARLWRGYATVPVLFGLGFHERNLVGNLFNMWLEGFHNPKLLGTADKIFRAVESGTNAGMKADMAIDASKALSPEERQWVRLARKEGVITDSFFRTDQAVTPSVGKSTVQKVSEAANPIDSHNVLLKSGTYIGRRIEDNSRLAMFIDQMQKHGDPAIAAANVKKALFDYSELTPTEAAIKKIVPFYTYMRKNTPLQLQAALQHPGKFAAVAHARDNLAAGAPSTNGAPIPQYALANGDIPLVGGKEPILGGFQLPFQNAAQNIAPILGMLSQMPGVPANLKTEGGIGPQIATLINNVGGGPAELGKYAVQEATGKDLFTGANLKPGTAGSQLLQTLVPLAGTGQTAVTKLGSNDSAVRNAKLISMLTGLQTTTLTPKAVAGEESRRSKALQALVPSGSKTLSQLRKSGAVTAKPRGALTKTKAGTKAGSSSRIKSTRAAAVKSNLPKAARPKV